MTKIKIIILSIIFLASVPIWAENESKTEKNSIVTIDEYLSAVVKKLPDLKINAIALARSKNNVKRSQGAGDVSIDSSFLYNSQKQYTVGNTFQMDYARGYTYSLQANKTFTSIGTRLSAGFTYNKTSVHGTLNTGESLNLSQYQPAVTVGISQPLLYNAFGTIDRFSERDAAMKLNVNKIQKELNDRSALNYYKKLYFDWIFYREALTILDGTIKNMKRLEGHVRRKRAAGLAENDDVQKVHANVLALQTQKKNYETTFKSTEKALNEFIDAPLSHPDKNSLKIYFKKSTENSYASIPFRETRNSKILQETLENYQYAHSVKNNMTLPQLNLIGAITQKSNESSFSNSFSQLNDTDYYVGLEFKYIFGNSAAKGEAKDAELALKEIKEENEKTRIQYERNLSENINNYNGFRDSYTLRNQKLKALQSQYRTERKKYYQARLNLQYLIDTENNIATERIEILRLQVYTIYSYLDYKDLTF